MRKTVHFVTPRVRSRLATAASALAMLAAMPAAYAAEAQQTAQSGAIDEITVTGTRVVRDGYEAPTPVSVLGADELNLAGRNNLAETVSRLPSFSNSALPRGRSATLNVTGITGVSNLNLRGMGGSRSLVLLDGARVVGSSLSGEVDVGVMPDGLIQRVDVVTGGASAAYGSDALSGVVNFVLDREFTGVKGNVEGGINSAGDGANYKLNLSAGVPFAGDRGHFLISGQHAYDNGIHGAPRGWRQDHNAAVINNPNWTATNGQPRLLEVFDFGLAAATPGGLITAGPLKGTYFGPGGAPAKLNYGTIISGSYMVGGDWKLTRFDQLSDLAFKMSRQNLFTRVGYDVSDNFNAYAMYQFSQIEGYSEDLRSWNLGNLTIRADNPYIPAAIAAQMATQGLTQFTLGTVNDDIGPMIQNNISTLRRWVVGAEGNFDAFDSNWAWEGYYQSSSTNISSNNRNVVHNARHVRAIDAVRNANGAIVCRVNADAVTTNDDPSCVPYNPMGTGVNSEAALNYVRGVSHGHTTLSQDVASLSTNGEPFELWAGPVSLALGIEHRREEVSGVPNPDDEANSWFAGNYHASFGKFNVTEGFLETVIPLAKDAAWAEAFDLSAAARFTDYSTSGFVTTWKVGATWTPYADLRFRATRSRDIRAPNLGELFNYGRVNTGTLLDPRNGQTLSIFTTTSGNVNLKPEIANTTGVGAVYAPSWLDGFTTSVDFYNIKINGAITSLGAQQYVDRCHAGDTYLCTFVTRDAAGTLTHVSILPANVLSQTARGIDFEATYRLPLASLTDSMDGDLTFRFLGTRALRMRTIDVLGLTIEGAGVNAEGMGTAPSSGFWAPKFKANLSATYNLDPFTASLTMRHISAGVYNRQFVECTSGCPASTAQNPTINNNDVPGANYFDLSLSYQIDGDALEAFMSVENLMDKDPPQVGGSVGAAFFTGSGALTIYDIMGRQFHAGVRFRY
ncbi:MAG: TonB-dependent receptor plug domain-containing protein [Rhodospirillaceae bacterium]